MKKEAKIYLIILAMALFAVSTPVVRAQSTDPSTPTPITSNDLTINGPKKNNEQHYYSFSAGPGEVTMTFHVKAKSSSTFVGVKIFDPEMNTLAYHNMSADTSSPGFAKKTFDVGQQQILVMSFTSDHSLGSCKITFGGAVDFSGGTPLNTGASGTTVSEVTPPVATETGGTPMESTPVTDTSQATGAIPQMSKNKASP